MLNTAQGSTPLPDRRICAIIVNYYKADRVNLCLMSLRNQTFADILAISVVDNSVYLTEAQTLRQAIRPGERLIITKNNLGYPRGVNLAVRNAGYDGDVLLISPDIILENPATIEIMAGLMQANPSIGILAVQQYNDDGSRVEIARRFPRPLRQLLRRIAPSRYSELSLLRELEVKQMIDVEWVQSSFVMIRRALWDSVSGLDERYYVFMSDIDLCHRAHDHGLRVVVSSAVTVRADGQRASAGTIWAFFRNRALRIHVRDAIIYYFLSKLRLGRKISKRLRP